MPLDPGKLRHRITIQSPSVVQDPTSGKTRTVWKDVATAVPAGIEPLSVSQFIAGQAQQNQVTARITIRYRDGLTPQMRFVGENRPYLGRIFNVQGLLNDPDSGLEYVTCPCSEGVNAGD